MPDGVLLAKQVHGTHVLWAAGVGASVEGRCDIEADAVLCDAGRGAGVLTADCVPLLLADPLSGFGAAVHAGWRGTLANVVEAALGALTDAGANPSRMVAAIGPCIRACCYEVSEALILDFEHVFGPRVARPGRHLDLVYANLQRLAACGISEARIEDLCECTRCAIDGGTPRYFSHRRDVSPSRQLSWLRFPARGS